MYSQESSVSLISEINVRYNMRGDVVEPTFSIENVLVLLYFSLLIAPFTALL